MFQSNRAFESPSCKPSPQANDQSQRKQWEEYTHRDVETSSKTIFKNIWFAELPVGQFLDGTDTRTRIVADRVKSLEECEA